jgi:molybdate transport system ATP-binding protein
MIEVHIEKSLGSFHLQVDFTAGNEVLALLGGSGSGKSMTLRAIAGIETPDKGRIVVDDTVFFDSEQKINLTPQQRQVGLLFQNYALFPTMTVVENIMMGVRSGSKAEKRALAEDALKRFALDGLGDRRPSQLSGGQQQRAALARILVGKPKILMLDEPFSALDSHLRDQMEQEVLDIIREFGGTTLLVSHSRDEVFRMADRIAVYDSGHIDALDEKHRVFQDPKTYRAALLTGCKNFSAVSGLRQENGVTYFHAADWDLDLQISGEHSGDIAGIRGHHLSLTDKPGANVFEMEIVQVIEDTFEYILMLRRSGTDGTLIHWMLPKTGLTALPQGKVLVRFPENALMLLAK